MHVDVDVGKLQQHTAGIHLFEHYLNGMVVGALDRQEGVDGLVWEKGRSVVGIWKSKRGGGLGRSSVVGDSLTIILMSEILRRITILYYNGLSFLTLIFVKGEPNCVFNSWLILITFGPTSLWRNFWGSLIFGRRLVTSSFR